MTLLAFLRHGRTAWNAERRFQGRTDIPLSGEGRKALAGLALPSDWAGARCHVSPLARARETAVLLGIAAKVEPRLIEMSFGRYEGRTRDELRADPDEGMAENEAKGLDFRPPGGESPREVQARLAPWLVELGQAGGRHVAISHKAVIRAALALAYDWPMLGRAPERLDWSRLHLFRVGPDGRLSPERMNVELIRA
jgi:broad specificity phosphatase PhoE